MTLPFVAPSDLSECEARLDILEHEQLDIKGQIATACIARNAGQRIDEVWLKRARYARTAKLEEMQKLRIWMREAKREAGTSVASEIAKICQERFTPAEWGEITALAEDRVRSSVLLAGSAVR